jgi:hypothetical protein
MISETDAAGGAKEGDRLCLMFCRRLGVKMAIQRAVLRQKSWYTPCRTMVRSASAVIADCRRGIPLVSRRPERSGGSIYGGVWCSIVAYPGACV